MSTHTPLQRHAPRSKSRHRLRTWIKRSVLAVGAVAGLVALVYAWLPSPVAVDTAIAARGALDVEVAEDGQTRVRERFMITAPASGVLERIELDPGTVVDRGTILARITPPDPVLLDHRTRDEAEARLAGALARVKRADAAIARATVARDAAVREAARGRQLVERGALAGADRDRLDSEEQLAIRDVGAATTERGAALAEVAAARAVLADDGRDDRAMRTVVAPSSGRVLRVLRDSAGPVAAGTPLLELGDLDAMEVVVDVLSSDAVQIQPKMEAVLEGWGGKPLRGEVRAVEPAAFTRISALGVEEQRVKVVLDVVEPARSLGDGFRIDARIFLWRGRGVLTVPAAALFRDRDHWALYIIEDGKARLVQVELGHRGRTDVEVTGIAPGTLVIIHPGDRVTDGARVQPR